ncbi:MAG: UDP-N-acetylmuramate--L-alanine ligase [Ruminococcaceae bacterium]|nr:UDP-N-acetylmuramate--L-alanine ligase [Oscillospiraceae bacterium]
MEQFNLQAITKDKPIYMIGIGGISMSALAILLKNAGYSVEGSDFKQSDMTQNLEQKGIHVNIGHKPENIGDVAAVVYTAAIREDNPELAHARTLDVPVAERAVLLGEIMKWYRCPVAVSGTHGKTTSTSMLSQILLAAELDPTILVGGILPSIGSNMRAGSEDYLITEACEYCGSFLKFFPKISIILNVDEDHLDYFKDIHDIINCFHEFAKKTPQDGLLIVNGDDRNTLAAIQGVTCPVCTFSTEDEGADFFAANIRYNENGCADFDILQKGSLLMHASLCVPGEHNVKNALAVTAAAVYMNIAPEQIQMGFNAFCGTRRRFEKKGEYRGAQVIDDYAHHPTEIRATLATAKKAAGNHRVLCVFQPHTYTRALKLRQEFAESFLECDSVIVVDIYAAREKDTGLISSREIAEDINRHSHNAVYAESFEAATAIISKRVTAGDCIITMGAGDVYAIGDALILKDSE